MRPETSDVSYLWDMLWRKIIAQRHVLAHEYGEVKHESIWLVATVHIPDLIERLEPLVPPPPLLPDIRFVR